MSQPPTPLPVPVHIAHAHELVRRLGEPLLGGNHADVLAEPEPAGAALLETLGSARDHINLDAALLHTAELHDDLMKRLITLCRQGVQVQVLAGTLREADGLGALRRAGATVNAMARPGGLSGWVEHRFQSMQRQLAVVDGRIAWCGPGARSPGNAGAHGPHVRVRGPIVQRLQRLFLERWKVSEPREAAARANHFPALALSGRQRMGVAMPAGSSTKSTVFGCPLIGAMDTARFSVFIALARRPPTQRLVRAIAAAASRGVNVSVLLQNGAPQAWPWRTTCAELMRAGAWLYQGNDTRPLPPHCIVDGVWSSVAIDGGLGWHSGDVIDAAQLIVLDAAFASELDQACQAAMAHALLLDVKSLGKPTPLRRWLHAGSAPHGADHALTSTPHPLEGPGLSP